MAERKRKGRKVEPPKRHRPYVPETIVDGIVDEFEAAVRSDEMSGSHHPLEFAGDKRRFEAAKTNLLKAIRKIADEGWEIH